MKKKIIVFLLIACLISTTLPAFSSNASASSGFAPIWPCDTSKVFVNSLDNYPKGGTHNGIDITPTDSGNAYQDIFAVADGTIVEARNSCSHETYNEYHACPDTWGNYICIQHTINGQTYYSIYAHLKYNSIVSYSGTVKAGQKIAQMGTSGGSTGHHLHLELWIGSRSDRKTDNRINYSFNYYVNNPSALKGVLFNPALTSASKSYGSWIVNNCNYVNSMYQYPDEEHYVEQCTPYASYLNVEITESTTLKSLPCSRGTNKTDEESTDIHTPSVGDTFTITGLYKNSANNYWYKTSYDGQDCYLYAGNAKVLEYLSDISSSGIKAPSSLNVGESFSIHGVISSNYTKIVNVGVAVDKGVTNPSNVLRAYDSPGNANSYSLLNSPVDRGITFNTLSEGTYTFRIYVEENNYFSDGTNLFYETLWPEPYRTTFTVGTPAPDPEDTTPGKPVLKSMKSEYSINEDIVFSWDATENTTHYNMYFDKLNDSGEYERIDTIHYAESGLSKKLSIGQYRVELQATNSNAYTPDGSTWAYTDGGWVYFSVIDPTPGKPVLKGMKSEYSNAEKIVFSWDATENTTHYNMYFDKLNSSGEYERIDTIHYAESGLSKKFTTGQYRVELQATNSNFYTPDGSTWVYTGGDYVYFSVVDASAGKPVLKGMKSEYLSTEEIVFSWDATENTLEYVVYIYELRTDGYEMYQAIVEAQSGCKMQLSDGSYRALVRSENYSGGTNGDWVYFEVVNPTPTGRCGDNLTWSFNEDTYTLTISGTGDMWDYGWAGFVNAFRPGWSKYFSTPVNFKLVIENGVTSIGANAFQYKRNYFSGNLTLPNSVKTIGIGAFDDSGFERINFGSGITEIGDGALTGCKEVRFKGDAPTFEESVFNGMTVYYPAGNTTWEAVIEQHSDKPVTWIANVPVTGVMLSAKTLDLVIGESSTLTATVLPGNATDKTVYWDCGSECYPTPVTVENGKITAVAPGTATITVLTEDGGFFDQCTVIVRDSNPEPDPNAPTAFIKEVKGRPGGTVDVEVELKNNPGIITMILQLGYDANTMTLTKVTDAGVLGAAMHTNNLNLNPYQLTWNNGTAPSDFVPNGKIVTLTFKIAADAKEGSYPITLSCNSTMNYALENVEFTTMNGTVTVSKTLIGDIDGDGVVDMKDSVLLQRYIAKMSGYDESSIDLLAADVDTSGVVDIKDSIILQRYVAKWSGYTTLPYAG